ncbi:carbohydrate deacetylase [Helcococcus massiliensis]|uniref:carbohydrate deacetylase n=1 Tax=Helcococcus massiliensis TaxID=2040290 RepID=UPI000CDEA90E|nr:carbohydrate deacetylase [Helcococcus massiliensis]
MGKLIINADDFGYGKGVNMGIIEAYQNGVLTSTTLMAGMPGFDQAVKLAKDNPGLGVGVHLTLTCGYPASKGLKTIVDDEGAFLNLSFYEKKDNLNLINLDEVYKEWKAQIDKVIDSGINPTHIDSHHHINSVGELKKIYLRLADEYSLPVRNNFNLPEGYKSTSKMMDYFDHIGSNKEIWRHMDTNNLIRDCKIYDSIEIMCHPAYVDSFLVENSSYTLGRTSTLKELLSPEIKKLLEDNEIELVTFRDI